MKSTWEGILASIFARFLRILGGNLEGKIEPRSIKNFTDDPDVVFDDREAEIQAIIKRLFSQEDYLLKI